ncbi:MAG: ferritin [Pseudomonadota bacterium]
MLKENVQKTLNEQINAELYSAYLYFSMSAHFQTKDLKGMANWFRVQAQEELFHATKLFDYVNDRGGRVTLTQVAGPPVEWDSPVTAFEEAFKHEQKVTSLINNLVELADKEKDRLTENFLQWFVAEQVEEEANVSEIVGQLKLVGTSGSGLFMIDRELAQRVFVMPTATTA